MRVDLQFAGLQLVADEQVLRDRQDFFAAEGIVAIPPALKVQEPLGFGIDVLMRWGERVLVPWKGRV